MQQLNVKITGNRPLLMHASTLANPRHPKTVAHKALTATRKKTDETHEAIARSEFLASCYWQSADGGGFHLPGINLEMSMIAAAKTRKLGVHFTRGVSIVEDECPLQIESKAATPEELWDDPNFVDVRSVRVSTARIMRYRPIFKRWSTSATILFEETIVEKSDVMTAIADAGRLIGVGDYRPRFGRFDVEFVQ